MDQYTSRIATVYKLSTLIGGNTSPFESKGWKSWLIDGIDQGLQFKDLEASKDTLSSSQLAIYSSSSPQLKVLALGVGVV